MTDWTDYRQNRQLRQLRDGMSSVSASLEAARSSQQRLRSDLSRVTGSIEHRIDRLAAAFDAFVELSDLRMTLVLFAEPAAVRHRARQMFGEHPLPGEPSDVAGYWLAPALAAVRAVVDGQPARPALELASSRDELRASLFHVLATALLARPDAVTGSMLAAALPELGPSPAMYQRALWLLAADGQLGTAGRDLVLRKGTECLAGLDGAERDAAVEAWLTAIKPERPASALVAAELGQAADLLAALAARERLGVLRGWVESSLAGCDGEPAAELDPLVSKTLELLVEEGSPVELPLLTRERELRRVIESNGDKASDGPHGWDSPAGSIVGLLRADVENGTHSGRRALAIRISAAHVLAAADRLAEQARRPVAEAVPAHTTMGTVTITTTGPDPGSLERATRRAAAAREVAAGRRTFGYGLGVGALVLAALAIVGGWGWLVPAVLAFAAAGRQLWRDHAERASAAEYAVEVRKRLRAEADRCVRSYLEACGNLDRGLTGIDADLAALHAALRPAP